MALHRIFVAVLLPEGLRSGVVDLQRQLEAAGAVARWVKPHQLHFTLRFLGEITPADVARARIAVRSAAAGIRPFSVTLAGLSAFPSLQRPQVVWVGVTAGDGELTALAARVNAELARHRFPPEDRPFRPHLTLARVRDIRRWGELVRALTALKDAAVGSFEVGQIVVMESRLTPKGPIHTPVEEVSLTPHEK